MADDIISSIFPEEDLKKLVASNLKFLREKHGFTQSQLADATKIPRTTIGRYEACMNMPSLSILLRIAKALSESPSAFISGWEEINF